jgi:Ni/Fe-hydrogenase subunit HybB-like protein
VLSGVALAAGGYTMAAAVYILGLEKYRPVVRPAILTGFLGYLFVVIGLLVDLGSPWRLPVPIFISHGTLSVMFEVAWCVALYSTVLAFEFLPPFFEWLGWSKARAKVIGMALPATVAGVMLSTLHQSSLGALFLLAPDKMHPLWYSSYIPVFFFVSSIVAGLSMVMVESALSHRAFRDQLTRRSTWTSTASRSAWRAAPPSCSSATSSCACRGCSTAAGSTCCRRPTAPGSRSRCSASSWRPRCCMPGPPATGG